MLFKWQTATKRLHRKVKVTLEPYAKRNSSDVGAYPAGIKLYLYETDFVVWAINRNKLKVFCQVKLVSY